MTYRDIEMLNQSFGNLNDTLIRNRMLKEQRAERQASQQRMEQDAAAQAAYRQQDLAERNRHNTEDEKLRQHMIDLETTKAATAKQNADTAAKKAGQTLMFKWTGEDGVDYSAKDPAEFAQLVKEHPAKKDSNGNHSLTMEGTDPKTGLHLRQTIDVDPNNPQSIEAAKKYVQDFSTQYGIAPEVQEPPTETVEYTTDEVKPTEAQPASNGFFGFFAHPAIPASPGIPEMKHKRKVPIGNIPDSVPPLPGSAPTPPKSKYKVEVLDQ